MGVDADNFSLHVEERSAGVTGIDGNVSLDEGNKLLVGKVAAFSGDNSCRDGIVQSEGGADGGNPFSDFNVFRFSEFYDGQVFPFNFDDSNIGFRICAQNLGLEFTLVGKMNSDFIGSVDNVVVREDDAVRIDDEAGALAAAFGRHTRAVEITEGKGKAETTQHFKLLVGHAVLRADAFCFPYSRNADNRLPVVFD